MIAAPTFPTLNTKQAAAADLIAKGGNVLVTGPAGTGKSVLLRHCRTEYPKLPVTASTGIAALNVGGCTLHSWASLGLGDQPAAAIAKKLNDAKNSNWYRIRTAERLAIDEISMIDADLFEKFDEVMQLVRGDRRPFGGLQLLIFGDFLQLPPVGKDGKPVRFAFECGAWDRGRIAVFLLDEIMRQADREFAELLSRIRVGDTSEDVRRVLRPRINAVDPDPRITAVELSTHNEIADGINKKHLDAITEPAEEWTAHDWAGSTMSRDRLDKDCIAPKTLVLKPGAQVMLLKNLDTEGGLVNGSLGRVVEIRKREFGEKQPVVEFTNGRVLEIERAEWKLARGDDVLASRRQFPLRLAWACSIHKSQGMTLDKVRVHLKHCFADGQAYVALSRARTLEGLFIADITGASIRANSTALDFYRRCAS